MKKIGFVTPWFGEKIPGGAEMELRGLVAHLNKANIELEIITTCVKDFNSDWNVNYHIAETTVEMDITVRRFSVRERNTSMFDAVNYKFMTNQTVTAEDEKIFLEEMINSPSLYSYIAENKDEYSLFVFIPYMFGTTFYGCQICPEKSILIPCLHNESYAYMNSFKEVYSKMAGMIFYSQPEFELANKMYDLSDVMASVLGAGVETDIQYNTLHFVEKYHIEDEFLLYAGRKDAGKNIDILIKYFIEFKKRKRTNLKLVLIGGGKVEIDQSLEGEIIDLGFVPVEDKYNAYSAAVALCQPSNNESFSLVIMESWLCKRPVIVSAKCDVTKHFASISNGGLYFSNYFEFESILEYLIKNPKIAKQMGVNGREFVLKHFKWDAIVDKYVHFFESVIHKRAENEFMDQRQEEKVYIPIKKKKIALVNQRYGLEVNGGSETHCRQLAEKLLEFYDVEVFTTCALDYMTWANYYTPGLEYINGVKVRRFKTDKSRDVEKFNRLSEKIFHVPHSEQDENDWVNEQGPYCPDFICYLKEHSKEYDAIIFMTYLYYLTVQGMRLNLENVLLLPTAHDEPPIYFKCYEKVFDCAKGIIYNTEEEKRFTESRFHVKNKPSVIAGVGVEAPLDFESVDIRKMLHFDERYIIYAGRIDESKGCKILFDYFMEYKKRNKVDLKLVLLGKKVMDIPKHKDIIYVGFVEEQVKFAAMKNSVALVLASQYESLSMVVLECMLMGRPVIVNGNCAVLKGHCLKSNAGLYFVNYFEFEGVLNYLLNNKQDDEMLSFNAINYVMTNYQWKTIVGKISKLIENK